MIKPTKRDIRGSTFDGTGRQMCNRIVGCPFRSIAGHRRGSGVCPYHWASMTWGRAWADRALPGYEVAASIRRGGADV